MAETNDPAFRPSEPLSARARAYCGRCEWRTAFDLLREADKRGGLDPEDLELLAQCARWIDRAEDVVDPLERAHAGYVARQDQRGAVRTALALCQANADSGNQGIAASWWQRADDLLPGLPEGPERGLHAWFLARRRGESGDLAGHEEAARRALELGRRSGDRNVEALALIEIGHVASARGRTLEALEALDRATALALAGEIGVFESGFVFCNAIWACRSRGDWKRALEWTDSATRWVDRQRVAYFPGLCRVHRAEVLRVRGDLEGAEEESTEATRMLKASIPRWETIAQVELGEVRRRRGDLAGALAAFRRSLELGWEPQPGLALVILAQGDAGGAHRAIERIFVQPLPTLLCEDRTNLLAARTTIAIAAGALDTAEGAVAELEALAESDSTPWDIASSARARAELELARGRAGEAVKHLVRARAVWAELESPYELAACRALLARALEAEGDATGATLEGEAAREIFDRIGAVLDRDQVARWLGARADAAPAAVARDDRAPSAVEEPVAREEPIGRLEREGDYWSLTFQGRSLRLKDSRGIAYLASLLESPGVDQWAIDLAGASAARDVRDLGDAGEVLDDEARASYKRRLSELQEELEETRKRNDVGRLEALQIEMDELTRQLAGAIGLGGRARRSGGVVERARQSVTKAVRGTIRRIARQDADLGRYLESTVSTGTACRFEPDPRHPVRWEVGRR